MNHALILMAAALLLVGCPSPAPPSDDDDATGDDDDSAIGDDDDATGDDDDSSAGDDDDATEEPTPEQVLIPPGAPVGEPGTLVGVRAIGSWDSVDWISNSVEVTLLEPPPPGAPPQPSPYGGVETVDPDLIALDALIKAAIVPAVRGTEEGSP